MPPCGKSATEYVPRRFRALLAQSIAERLGAWQPRSAGEPVEIRRGRQPPPPLALAPRPRLRDGGEDRGAAGGHGRRLEGRGVHEGGGLARRRPEAVGRAGAHRERCVSGAGALRRAHSATAHQTSSRRQSAKAKRRGWAEIAPTSTQANPSRPAWPNPGRTWATRGGSRPKADLGPKCVTSVTAVGPGSTKLWSDFGQLWPGEQTSKICPL